MPRSPLEGAGTRCYVAGMRTFVAGLIFFGAFLLVSLVGVIAFLAAEKLALHLDPAANESHLTGFMVAITGIAMAVASAFPIFGHGVPWVAARVEGAWPERPPEQPVQ